MDYLDIHGTILPDKRIIRADIVTTTYISGYDDSDRPASGFFKKLFYKPKPILKTADFYVIHYYLPKDCPHVRSGVTHRTSCYCLCNQPEAAAAIRRLAKDYQSKYANGNNESRTRLERSEDLYKLRTLGLLPSLIEEPDETDIISAWTRSRGTNLVTYSYLIADFDEYCDEILIDWEGEYPAYRKG